MELHRFNPLISPQFVKSNYSRYSSEKGAFSFTALPHQTLQTARHHLIIHDLDIYVLFALAFIDAPRALNNNQNESNKKFMRRVER